MKTNRKGFEFPFLERFGLKSKKMPQNLLTQYWLDYTLVKIFFWFCQNNMFRESVFG